MAGPGASAEGRSGGMSTITGSEAAGRRRPRNDGAGEMAAMLKSIRRIVRAIDVRSKAVAKAVGLTIPQIVVLQAVRDLGEVTTGQLSAYADLSAATVITILDNLEAKGLVERYRSLSDRRIVHTRLTAAGRRTLERAPSLLPDELVMAFRRLPREERDALIDAFARVAGMVDMPTSGMA